MFYVGNEFNKEENKPYKTIDGAKKAADKAGAFVFDEEGVKVHPIKAQLTDEVPDGALEVNEDGSVNTYNEDGEKVGTATPEEVQAAMDQITEEDIQQAAAAAKADDSEDDQAAMDQNAEDGVQQATAAKTGDPKVMEVHGKIRRVFDGKLRLRRKPSFDDDAVCGVTMFTEKTAVKKFTTDRGVLYETSDGYFVSGDPKHVKFIPDQKEE